MVTTYPVNVSSQDTVPARTYDYSPAHRFLEVCGIAGLALIVALGLYECSLGLGLFPEAGWWVIPSTLIMAYLAADFVSGLVHFLGDTFGDEKTWLLGEAFIKPFREHHIDPRGITRHDFIETNGNNCIVSIPGAFCFYYFIPARHELWALWLLGFCMLLVVGVFMTNQFHKWAHLEKPPAWIQRLQAWRLILGTDHHDVHHTPPFDRYYCITTGWLNPVLDKLHFFPALQWVLAWFLPAPRPGSIGIAPAPVGAEAVSGAESGA
jgi:hypothetical protein